MEYARTVSSQEPRDKPPTLAFGAADETLIAHADEIAQAVRTAPSGTCVRADAGDDRSWRGLRVLSQGERNDPEQAMAPDGVAFFWDADPKATADSVAAEIREFSARGGPEISSATR